MPLIGANAARCAEGHHQWQSIDGCRHIGAHTERCSNCGTSGVWVPVGLTLDGE